MQQRKPLRGDPVQLFEIVAQLGCIAEMQFRNHRSNIPALSDEFAREPTPQSPTSLAWGCLEFLHKEPL